MKICISAESDKLDAKVDARFGRSGYFIFINTENDEFEAIKNPNEETAGGAGIQAGQLMDTHGVGVVLTGNVGPNAFSTLQAAGIKIVTGVSGTVKEALENYQSGKYEDTKEPSVDSKFGVN
ncbi:MAG: dinitrogenase iron-molybdenum cofactor biosynthesis protein [Candidatus Omnitrophota bacterium]|nr:MAG: dinitrogenase iron-molybdenum cofactor biosynthesis protein [Candidatus Omnitrophota bacterium]